jgi:hypothetical protein
MDVDTTPWLNETIQTSPDQKDTFIACLSVHTLPSPFRLLDRSTPPIPSPICQVSFSLWRCSRIRAARRRLSPIAFIADNFSIWIAAWFVLEQYWLIPDLLESWWFSRGTRLFMAGGIWGFSLIMLSIRSSVQHFILASLALVYMTLKLMWGLARGTAEYQSPLYRRCHRYLYDPVRRGKMEIWACVIGFFCIYVCYLMYSLSEGGPPGVERTVGYAFYVTSTCLVLTFCALSAFLTPT